MTAAARHTPAEPGAEDPSKRRRLGERLGTPRWDIVVAGYLLALGAGWGYGASLRAAGSWDLGAPWERSLLLAVDTDWPLWLDALLYVIPWAGTNLTLGPLVGVLAAWLLWQRRLDLALWVGTVELGVMSLNWVVKHLLVRERPDIIERVGWFGWASYPSGHVMSSLAVLMTLGALLHHATGHRWGTWLAFGVFAVISWSRLVHGVHWPTDIIGGALTGLVWLVATWFAFVGLPGTASRR